VLSPDAVPKNWLEADDGPKAAPTPMRDPDHWPMPVPPQPKVVDPLLQDCSRVVGFATGEAPEYSEAVAKEWLALYRFVTGVDAPSRDERIVAAEEHGRALERARICEIIDGRKAHWLRRMFANESAAARAAELQWVADKIDPPELPAVAALRAQEAA